MNTKAKKQEQETDAAQLSTDEFAGQGGSYIIEGGKRKLVQRTQEAGAKPAEAGNGRASSEK